MKLSNDLRQSVLQAAMEGKLTKQLKEDGNADDLLGLIEKEKAKLIKEKKIKKTKPLPKISEDEIPFDIPDNWKWVRLNDIGTIIGGGTPSKGNSDYWTNGSIAWITPADMNFKGKYIHSGKRNITDAGLRHSSAQKIPKNSIIISSRAPIGYVKIITQEGTTSQGCKTFSPILVDCEFYYYIIIARKDDLIHRASGTTFKEISGNGVANTIVPLPPLAEQHRIVEKVDMLMAEIDELEKKENELEKLKKEFPEDMKASLLQAAMEGKLTEQLPEDGNADDLLEAINSEKAKLIKEKKIKKPKLLPEISEGEIPFDIPDNWRWVRLGDIVYNHGQKKPTAPFSYVDVGTLDNINYKLNDVENILEPDKAPSRARKIIKEGDIIYSTVRPYLHNICIINKKFSKEPIASTAFAVMACYSSIFNKYLFYYLLSPSFDLYANSPENSKGVAYPAINDKTFYNGIIPLPPLAEQRRIVKRLDELLPLCEELKGDEGHG